MKDDVSLCGYSRDFLLKSRIWLRDAYVRYYADVSDFTDAESEEWFSRLPSDNSRLTWGLKCGEIPIGACGLKLDDVASGAEYWGYIGEAQFRGRGCGKKMMALVEQAAQERGVCDIWLKVRPDNVPAVALYRKSGYEEYARDSKLIYMRKTL